MITGIVTVAGGIVVMLSSGVALSTALHWMNTFEFDATKRRAGNKGRPGNHSRASEGRNRMGGRGPGASLDGFE